MLEFLCRKRSTKYKPKNRRQLFSGRAGVSRIFKYNIITREKIVDICIFLIRLQAIRYYTFIRVLRGP